MEQKDYKLEIILLLINNRCHVRGLAKELNINHMTVFRNIKNLSEENVVDYIQEGKNKIYFLKETIEARAYFLIAENYKLMKLLEKYPHLRKIIEKIQEDKKIKLAILFGSYVKGLAKKGSDIDIYIEVLDQKIKKELELCSSQLSVKIGKYDKKSLLIKEIEKNHVIIKGGEIFYGKYKFS